jgi:hypothetical protein
MNKDVNSRTHTLYPHVLEIIKAGLRQNKISLKLFTPREILVMYGSNYKK